MFLRLQTDYALRTLIYLAHRKEQCSVEEIASTFKISKDHLFKIVQQLGRLGYVVSRAGRKGGVRISKPAEQINVGKVIAEFEGRNGMLECVEDPSVCNLEPGCVLRTLLIQAEKNFYDTLEKMTIADVLRPNVAIKHGGVFNLTIAGRPTATTADAESAAKSASSEIGQG